MIIIMAINLLSIFFLCNVGIYQYIKLTEIKLNNKEF